MGDGSIYMAYFLGFLLDAFTDFPILLVVFFCRASIILLFGVATGLALP